VANWAKFSRVQPSRVGSESCDAQITEKWVRYGFNAAPRTRHRRFLIIRYRESGPEMPKAKKSQLNMDSLVDAIEGRAELLSLLERSHIPEHREHLSSELSKHFAQISGRKKDSSKDIYSDLVKFLWYGIPIPTTQAALILGCRRMRGRPPGVSTALATLERNKTHKKQQRKQLVENLGLTPKTRHSRIANIRTVRLTRLEAPYPPPMRDIYETEEIGDIWHNHRNGKEHPDGRSRTTGHWMELEKLDKSMLSLIVGPDESVIVRDAQTDEIVSVVIRDFCGDCEVLDWVNGIIDENVGLRRGIRVCKVMRSVLWY
jgi:hypothetical protein